MTRTVVSSTNGKTCLNSSRFESVEPNREKCHPRTRDNRIPTPRLIVKEVSDRGAAEFNESS
jgi:hypothetical protein